MNNVDFVACFVSTQFFSINRSRTEDWLTDYGDRKIIQGMNTFQTAICGAVTDNLFCDNPIYRGPRGPGRWGRWAGGGRGGN